MVEELYKQKLWYKQGLDPHQMDYFLPNYERFRILSLRRVQSQIISSILQSRELEYFLQFMICITWHYITDPTSWLIASDVLTDFTSLTTNQLLGLQKTLQLCISWISWIHIEATLFVFMFLPPPVTSLRISTNSEHVLSRTHLATNAPSKSIL